MPSFNPKALHATEALQSHTLRLRFVALVAGVAGALTITLRTVLLVADWPMLWPDSWVARLALLLGPLVGIVGVCTGYGIWTGRRWGATAFTAWVALLLGHFAVTPFLAVAFGGFAIGPMLRAFLMLILSVGVAILVIRIVRRWLIAAIGSHPTLGAP